MKFKHAASRMAFLLLLGSAVAHAGESVDETQSAAADGYVQIKVVRGDVDIHGWRREEIRITGSLDDSTKNFIFDVKDDEAVIRVEIDDDFDWFDWSDREGTDIDIYLPEASRIVMSGVSVDVTAQGLTGELDLGLVSGDIEVEDVAGEVELQTVSGDMRLRQIEGGLEVKTVSGDVDGLAIRGVSAYSSVSGDIQISDGGHEMGMETVSGDIEIKADIIGELRGQSISGDVEIVGRPASGGQIRFDSVSGSIELALAGKLSLNLYLETKSGEIRNEITDDRPRTSEYSRGESLRFSLNEYESKGKGKEKGRGKGKGRTEIRDRGKVTVSTRSGDITISRHAD